MREKANAQGSTDAAAASGSEWTSPSVRKLRAGSAEVGTRTVVQDGPLAESRS